MNIFSFVRWKKNRFFIVAGLNGEKKRKIRNRTILKCVFLVVEHEDEMEIDNENACFHKRPLQNTEHTYHFKVYAIRFYIVERQNRRSETKRNKTGTQIE